MSDKKIKLEIYRYRPDDGETEPTYETFEVPYSEDWVILDAINYVKDELDGTLAFRWSCRMGVCGSCGMMVNGQAKLTCATFLRDYYPAQIRIEPLANFPVERDLITDISSFIEKLKKVKSWTIPKEEKSIEDGENLQTPAQLERFKQYSMCINCLCCYSACPQVAHEPDFLGPAVIAIAQRYNLDSRDGGSKVRNDEIFSDEGAWCCTFIGECSTVCPKHVDPAEAIQRAKVSATTDWFKRIILPGGKK